MKSDEYFDPVMVNRQRLLWSVAVRQELERWEPYVARNVHLHLVDKRPGLAGDEVWQAQIEHHLLLVAANNLLTAIDLKGPHSVRVQQTTRDELVQARDLHEHWRENMPIFNVTPRQRQSKYRCAQAYAARYSRRSPYDPLARNSGRGALVTPDVPAPALHRILDRLQRAVLKADPELARLVPGRHESPWIEINGEVWPRSMTSQA